MRASTCEILKNLVRRYPALGTCEAEIDSAAVHMLDCFTKNRKLLVCGNGGSAADSEHIVGELMKTFMLNRPLDEDMCKNLRTAYPEYA